MKPPTGIVKHRRRTTNDERRTTENPLRIGLIGCGRVGTAIALGLKRAGHRIVWVKDIDPKAERRAEHLLGPGLMPKALRLMPDAADVILIATPDAEIVAAYREIADSLSPNQTVVHFSGALTSQNIQHPAPNTQHPNHGVLAMHPVMTFPKCGIRGLTTKTPRHQGNLTEKIGGNRWIP